MGASYRVELKAGALIYTKSDAGHRNPQPVPVTPTAAHWQEFRQALDEIKIWEWRGEYPSNGVVDGTQWSLDITYADHALKTHGDNSYPDAAGKPNGKPLPTPAFNRYLAAVQKLIGGKKFE